MNIITRYWQEYQQRKVEKYELAQTIDMVVELADPTIKRASRYQRTLADPVRQVMAHSLNLLSAVPGPVTLDRNSYFKNPLVRALFASPEEMEELIRLSPDVENLRKTGFTGTAKGLLTMNRNEKTIFGHEKKGDILLRDVRQKMVSFSDHRIVAPAASFARTRDGIQVRGLEVMATVAMERITLLRNQISELRKKRDYLKGTIKIYEGKSRLHNRFGATSTEIENKLSEAREHLALVREQLAAALDILSYPEDALQQLTEVMEQPASLMTVGLESITVDWMHIIHGDDSGDKVNTIELAVFRLMEELQRHAIFVDFSITDN